MSRPKGLIVRPATGIAWPFATLVVAEAFARGLVAEGRGPVEIVSAYTGAVLDRYVWRDGEVWREEAGCE